MATGTLKTWKADRGFGFIAPDDGGPHIFVHVTQFKAEPEDIPLKQRVQFDHGTSERSGKAEAKNVEFI